MLNLLNIKVMKKLILFEIALLFSLSFATAQGWQNNGAYDDFAQTDFYKNGPNQEGIVWFADGVFSLNRPGNGTLTVTATNAGGSGNYPLFGVNFNDSNDDGTGTPFVVDLSGGMADVQIDIENTSSQLLFIDVKLVDINNIQSEIEPNVSDITPASTWAEVNKRKALNGFTLAAGQRKTIRIDLSSVPENLGGLTPVSYANCGTGPYYCPTTSYQIDPSQIKAVLFRVNFGSDNIELSEGDGDHTVQTFISGSSIIPFNGNIVIREFKVGAPVTVAGISKAMIDRSLSIYPNPADHVLTVSFETNEVAEISLTDIAGSTVMTTSAGAGSNKISMNTSELPSGIYILNITTGNGVIARKVSVK
jgi:hypothetical protein